MPSYPTHFQATCVNEIGRGYCSFRYFYFADVKHYHCRVPIGSGKHRKSLKRPCIEMSWNLKNDEISWQNHGILL